MYSPIANSHDHKVAEHMADAPSSREWWELLLFLLPIMFAVGALGVYLVPVHPEITLLLVGWASLLLVLAWLIAIRMSRELRLSRYQWVEYLKNGTPIIGWRREYFVPVMFLITLTALGAGLLDFGMLSPDYFLSIRSPFMLFILGFVLSLIIALLWFLTAHGWEAALDRLLGKYRLLILCLLIAFGLNSMDWSFLEYVPDGPASSWQEQLDFAQHEAERVVGEASLAVDVRARSADFMPYGPEHPLEVTFGFVSSLGRWTEVRILDSHPPRLQGISRNSGGSGPLSEREKQELVQQFATVKLSPRQVYRQILPLAEHLKQTPINSNFDVSLFSGEEILKDYKVPAAWVADYDSEYFFMLNPSTGEVLKTRLPDILDNTPAPTPAK